MNLSRDDLIHSGTPADIFHSTGAGRVWKLFRRHVRDSDGRAVQAVFRAERDALKVASECPPTAAHVPAFFGALEIDQVLDVTGRDVSGEYHLDCCYSIAFVTGREYPAIAILEYDWGKHLAAKLEELGIEYWIDGSVFLSCSRSSGVLIDIAMRDVRADFAHVFKE